MKEDLNHAQEHTSLSLPVISTLGSHGDGASGTQTLGQLCFPYPAAHAVPTEVVPSLMKRAPTKLGFGQLVLPVHLGCVLRF